jgi:hypothetical protein
MIINFKISCGIDEEAGESTAPENSHMMNATTTANTHPAGAEPDPSDQQRKSTQDEEPTNTRKEKSVLQAKLTKLAIQIGYGGIPSIHTFYYIDFDH